MLREGDQLVNGLALDNFCFVPEFPGEFLKQIIRVWGCRVDDEYWLKWFDAKVPVYGSVGFAIKQFAAQMCKITFGFLFAARLGLSSCKSVGNQVQPNFSQTLFQMMSCCLSLSLVLRSGT